MKIRNFFILAALVTVLGSCVKQEFDTPPINIPAVDFPSNTTIAQLKAMHPYPGLVDTIGTDIIIQGIVVANDESGNYYKAMVIQDGTAGIEIRMDKSSIYNEYKVGQRVFIKCNGLCLGDYGGLTQIGYNVNNSIQRIPDALLTLHLFKDSLPGSAPQPRVVTIPDINITDSLNSTLIRINGVQFAEPGMPFAVTGSSGTDRIVTDANNNTLVVRTSSYADFANTKTPSGIGDIIGVIGVYNSVKQFTLRNYSDVINFVPDDTARHINEIFASSLGSFTQFSVIGSQIWTASTYSGITLAKISGYENSVYYANEDWLISSPFNLDISTGEILKFQSAMNYGTAGDGSLKVYFTDNYTGDPTTTTWTEITATLSSGGWVFTPSGDIDMSTYTGTACRIAFKYTCSTSNVATWELTSISLKGLLSK